MGPTAAVDGSAASMGWLPATRSLETTALFAGPKVPAVADDNEAPSAGALDGFWWKVALAAASLLDPAGACGRTCADDGARIAAVEMIGCWAVTPCGMTCADEGVGTVDPPVAEVEMIGCWTVSGCGMTDADDGAGPPVAEVEAIGGYAAACPAGSNCCGLSMDHPA